MTTVTGKVQIKFDVFSVANAQIFSGLFVLH